jgi:hypothetical protein
LKKDRQIFVNTTVGANNLINLKRAKMLDRSSYLNVWWIATLPFLLIKGVTMLVSTCCGSEPLYQAHKFDNEWVGLCGCCKDHAEFEDHGEEHSCMIEMTKYKSNNIKKAQKKNTNEVN